MKDKKLKEQLNHLARASQETPPLGLAEQIKEQIPPSFPHHRGLDNINIMIDLRISRLAAAAVIIITVLFCVSFLGGNQPGVDNIYRNSKVLLKYWVGGQAGANGGFSPDDSELYKRLVPKDKDAVYYGNFVEMGDGDSILMYWKLSEGEYKVVFGDLKIKECNTEELLKLQSRMLKRKTE